MLVDSQLLRAAACPQAVLAEAEAADGERKTLGEQLAAAKKTVKELEKQVGACLIDALSVFTADQGGAEEQSGAAAC